MYLPMLIKVHCVENSNVWLIGISKRFPAKWGYALADLCSKVKDILYVIYNKVLDIE